jgi:hypothetical protein
MRAIRFFVAITVFVFCAGCSSFDAKWRAASVGAKSAHCSLSSVPHYASRWDGRWTSEHHKTLSGSPSGGRLRCVIEPVDEKGIIVHFHANWLTFSADYSVPLKAKRSVQHRGGDIVMEYVGTHELPKAFGGTYQYVAWISANRFAARYTSTYDRGRFEMTRQLTKPAPIH